MQAAIPDQPISVQRRELDMEDYLDIVRRHRAWIIGPAFLGLVLGVMGAYLWPDTYTSTGQIRVVPPQVSARLVASNLNEEMSQRVNAIYQDIISHDSLTNMIQTHTLYPDKLRRLPMEDVLEIMKKDIVPSSLRGLNTVVGGGRVFAFSVSYSYSDRRTARLVCQEIISKFLNETTRARSSESNSTTDFFTQESRSAKQELEDIDRKIADFKAANTGALPEEAQSLLFLVSSTDQNIQNLSMSVNRVSQDKLQLEAQLHFQEEQLPLPATAPAVNAAPGSPPVAVIRDQHLDDLDRDIAKDEEVLSQLRQSYKDSHPDVQRTMVALAAKRKERDQYAAQLSSVKPVAIPGRSGPSQAAPVGASRELRASIARLQAQIQAKDMELEELNRQIEAARTRSKTLQAQVAASPLARSSYMALLRDRENAATRYSGMTMRLQDSTLSTDLDKRGQGETLEQLEAASLPTTPSAPKRPMIIFVALALGIGLGIGVAIARELRDVSLKSLKDVRAYTRLTILGSVPLLENDFVVRRRRRMAWLGWSAAFVIGVLLMSGSVIYYYTSKS
jgi:uncharacterized protein involved in exopolysaccharide biosynthesis